LGPEAALGLSASAVSLVLGYSDRAALCLGASVVKAVRFLTASAALGQPLSPLVRTRCDGRVQTTLDSRHSWARPWWVLHLAAATRAPLLSNVLLRILSELGLAALGAEVYRLPFVFAGGSSLFGINRHFAYRVNNLHDFTSRSGIFTRRAGPRRVPS